MFFIFALFLLLGRKGVAFYLKSLFPTLISPFCHWLSHKHKILIPGVRPPSAFLAVAPSLHTPQQVGRGGAESLSSPLQRLQRSGLRWSWKLLSDFKPTIGSPRTSRCGGLVPGLLHLEPLTTAPDNEMSGIIHNQPAALTPSWSRELLFRASEAQMRHAVPTPQSCCSASRPSAPEKQLAESPPPLGPRESLNFHAPQISFEVFECWWGELVLRGTFLHRLKSTGVPAFPHLRLKFLELAPKNPGGIPWGCRPRARGCPPAPSWGSRCAGLPHLQRGPDWICQPRVVGAGPKEPDSVRDGLRGWVWVKKMQSRYAGCSGPGPLLASTLGNDRPGLEPQIPFPPTQQPECAGQGPEGVEKREGRNSGRLRWLGEPATRLRAALPGSFGAPLATPLPRDVWCPPPRFCYRMRGELSSRGADGVCRRGVCRGDGGVGERVGGGGCRFCRIPFPAPFCRPHFPSPPFPPCTPHFQSRFS